MFHNYGFRGFRRFFWCVFCFVFNMLVFLYRWKIKVGQEAEFIENWTVMTKLLREQGSLGSRLHRCDDGYFYGYAQWKSNECREKAFLATKDAPARALMREVIEESLPEICLNPIVDLLVHDS